MRPLQITVRKRHKAENLRFPTKEAPVDRSLQLVLAAASTFGLAPPASAQSPAGTTPGAQTKPVDPMSEIVCQKQEVVGSRLATRRVCMTRYQWREQRTMDRQDTEKAQLPSAKSTPG